MNDKVQSGIPATFARKNSNMGLGKKKGHVHGKNVSGGHSTLIDGADAVVKKLGAFSWPVTESEDASEKRAKKKMQRR
jgi:hypothetical protein